MKKQKPDKLSRPEARARAETLIREAQATWPDEPEKAKKRVHKARQMAMKYRVHLDPKTFCRRCGVPFVADTLKVRLERQNKTVLYACRNCQYRRRVPYKRNRLSLRKGRQPGPMRRAPQA